MGSSCKDDKKDNTLTDYELSIYEQKRLKVFKGTIAICVLYAIIAIALLVLANVSEKIKFLLLNNFLPFTIVFIIGTIIIVAFLMNQVLNFKPYKIDKNSKYDNLSCPDYWNLEKIPNLETDSDFNTFSSLFDSNVNANLFKYRCVMNSNVFDKYAISNLNPSDFTASPYIDRAIYGFTNLNSLDDIPSNRNIIHDNSLYKNILHRASSSNVLSNIFQNKNELLYKLAENNLLMNNYQKTDIVDGNYIIFQLQNNNSNIRKTAYDNYKINSNLYDNEISGLDYKNAYNYIKINKNNIGDIQGKIDTGDSYTPMDKLPMICDSVYPMFLASKDEILNSTDNKYDNNVFRCAYSKLCKVPWSDMNCDNYKDD
jgi:hypothetical protein